MKLVDVGFKFMGGKVLCEYTGKHSYDKMIDGARLALNRLNDTMAFSTSGFVPPKKQFYVAEKIPMDSTNDFVPPKKQFYVATDSTNDFVSLKKQFYITDKIPTEGE